MRMVEKIYEEVLHLIAELIVMLNSIDWNGVIQGYKDLLQ